MDIKKLTSKTLLTTFAGFIPLMSKEELEIFKTEIKNISNEVKNYAPHKKVYENFQELTPEKRDLVEYHFELKEEINKTDGPIYLDSEKYKIKEKDRLEWDKEKETEKSLLEMLGKEKISYLKSLGEQGVKNLLDKLIVSAPSNDNEHKDWDEIGDILDYVNNKKYNWLTEYQIKSSKKYYGSV